MHHRVLPLPARLQAVPSHFFWQKTITEPKSHHLVKNGPSSCFHALNPLKNPILGIILGCAMTAVLQSSSASVGILQALASTGAITFSTAVPIILGQNVGKCVTVILASIGSKKAAKRAVFIDVLANVCGMIFFFVVVYGLNLVLKFSFWDSTMTRGNIADFHTLFNICTTIILLPFVVKYVL